MEKSTCHKQCVTDPTTFSYAHKKHLKKNKREKLK